MPRVVLVQLPAHAHAAEPAAGVRTVLIVDDEPSVLQAIQDLLKAHGSNGWRIMIARSGWEALELLERNPISLVICDYRMPGMNGIELLRRARRVAPDVRRMLMTAYPDLEVALMAINEGGIRHFFCKPFDAEELLRAVNQELQPGA